MNSLFPLVLSLASRWASTTECRWPSAEPQVPRRDLGAAGAAQAFPIDGHDSRLLLCSISVTRLALAIGASLGGALDPQHLRVGTGALAMIATPSMLLTKPSAERSSPARYVVSSFAGGALVTTTR